MDIIEVEFHLLWRTLRGCCVVDSGVYHLGGFGRELGGADGPLSGVGDHLVWCADEDPVADFVAVGPVGGGGEFGVGADFGEELREGFGAGDGGERFGA